MPLARDFPFELHLEPIRNAYLLQKHRKILKWWEITRNTSRAPSWHRRVRCRSNSSALRYLLRLSRRNAVLSVADRMQGQSETYKWDFFRIFSFFSVLCRLLQVSSLPCDNPGTGGQSSRDASRQCRMIVTQSKINFCHFDKAYKVNLSTTTLGLRDRESGRYQKLVVVRSCKVETRVKMYGLFVPPGQKYRGGHYGEVTARLIEEVYFLAL